jgi:hypothetical protein
MKFNRINVYIAIALISYGCAPTQQPFDVFSDPSARQEALTGAERQLLSIGVVEPPSFWTRIVNDEKYSEAHRRQCLGEFFLRHVKPGTPISIFAQNGAANWFNRDNFSLSIPGGKPPIKIKSDAGPLFVFAPDLLRRQQAAIYIQISQKMNPDSVLGVIHGENPLPITIARIGIGGIASVKVTDRN